MTQAAAARCPRCCEHGLPYSAEDQQRYGTPGWCGWCEDISDDCHADRMDPADPQWMCPHGIGAWPPGAAR